MKKFNSILRDKATTALAGFHYPGQIWGQEISSMKTNNKTQPTTNVWQYEINNFSYLLLSITREDDYNKITRGWLQIKRTQMEYHGCAKKREKKNLCTLWCTTKFSEEHVFVAYLFKRSLLIKPLQHLPSLSSVS